MTKRNISSSQVVAVIMAAMILCVLITQTHLLYRFPQPDSARWWGDETGQMIELRTEFVQGYARIPTALGSTLATTNGLLRGNSWLAALTYGTAVLVFQSVATVVEIGRTLTWLFSIVLLLVMWKLLRRSGVSVLLSMLAILLLVSTRSFFFASHSARLDVTAGLAVIWIVLYLCDRDRERILAVWKPSGLWWFVCGASLILLSTLSIHLLTLLGALSIVLLIRWQAFRKPRFVLSFVLGALLMLAVLLLIYTVSGASVTVLGQSHGANQFRDVIDMLPIMRPFSMSVQTGNLLERISGLWSEAPAVLVFTVITIIAIVVRPRQKQTHQHFLFVAAIIELVAWLLFQSPALYYYIHILPLAIVATMVLLSKSERGWFAIPVFMAAAVLAVSGIRDASRASTLSNAIDWDNHLAVSNVVNTVQSLHAGHPLILAQNPAIAELYSDTSINLMTAQLVSFPATTKPMSEVLRSLGVQFIVLYNNPDDTNYSVDYHALKSVVASNAKEVSRQSGIFLDAGRDYFHTDLSRRDTMILYTLLP